MWCLRLVILLWRQESTIIDIYFSCDWNWLGPSGGLKLLLDAQQYEYMKYDGINERGFEAVMVKFQNVLLKN